MGGIPLDDEQQKVYRELSNEQVEFYNNLSDDEKKEYLKIKVPEEREQYEIIFNNQSHAGRNAFICVGGVFDELFNRGVKKKIGGKLLQLAGDAVLEVATDGAASEIAAPNAAKAAGAIIDTFYTAFDGPMWDCAINNAMSWWTGEGATCKPGQYAIGADGLTKDQAEAGCNACTPIYGSRLDTYDIQDDEKKGTLNPANSSHYDTIMCENEDTTRYFRPPPEGICDVRLYPEYGIKPRDPFNYLTNTNIDRATCNNCGGVLGEGPPIPGFSYEQRRFPVKSEQMCPTSEKPEDARPNWMPGDFHGTATYEINKKISESNNISRCKKVPGRTTTDGKPVCEIFDNNQPQFECNWNSVLNECSLGKIKSDTSSETWGSFVMTEVMGTVQDVSNWWDNLDRTKYKRHADPVWGGSGNFRASRRSNWNLPEYTPLSPWDKVFPDKKVGPGDYLIPPGSDPDLKILGSSSPTPGFNQYGEKEEQLSRYYFKEEFENTNVCQTDDMRMAGPESSKTTADVSGKTVFGGDRSDGVVSHQLSNYCCPNPPGAAVCPRFNSSDLEIQKWNVKDSGDISPENIAYLAPTTEDGRRIKEELDAKLKQGEEIWTGFGRTIMTDGDGWEGGGWNDDSTHKNNDMKHYWDNSSPWQPDGNRLGHNYDPTNQISTLQCYNKRIDMSTANSLPFKRSPRSYSGIDCGPKSCDPNKTGSSSCSPTERRKIQGYEQLEEDDKKLKNWLSGGGFMIDAKRPEYSSTEVVHGQLTEEWWPGKVYVPNILPDGKLNIYKKFGATHGSERVLNEYQNEIHRRGVIYATPDSIDQSKVLNEDHHRARNLSIKGTGDYHGKKWETLEEKRRLVQEGGDPDSGLELPENDPLNYYFGTRFTLNIDSYYDYENDRATGKQYYESPDSCVKKDIYGKCKINGGSSEPYFLKKTSEKGFCDCPPEDWPVSPKGVGVWPSNLVCSNKGDRSYTLAPGNTAIFSPRMRSKCREHKNKEQCESATIPTYTFYDQVADFKPTTDSSLGCKENISLEQAQSFCNNAADCNGFFSYQGDSGRSGRVCFKNEFNTLSELNKITNTNVHGSTDNSGFYVLNPDGRGPSRAEERKSCEDAQDKCQKKGTNVMLMSEDLGSHSDLKPQQEKVLNQTGVDIGQISDRFANDSQNMYEVTRDNNTALFYANQIFPIDQETVDKVQGITEDTSGDDQPINNNSICKWYNHEDPWGAIGTDNPDEITKREALWGNGTESKRQEAITMNNFNHGKSGDPVYYGWGWDETTAVSHQGYVRGEATRWVELPDNYERPPDLPVQEKLLDDSDVNQLVNRWLGGLNFSGGCNGEECSDLDKSKFMQYVYDSEFCRGNIDKENPDSGEEPTMDQIASNLLKNESTGSAIIGDNDQDEEAESDETFCKGTRMRIGGDNTGAYPEAKPYERGGITPCPPGVKNCGGRPALGSVYSAETGELERETVFFRKVGDPDGVERDSIRSTELSCENAHQVFDFNGILSPKCAENCKLCYQEDINGVKKRCTARKDANGQPVQGQCIAETEPCTGKSRLNQKPPETVNQVIKHIKKKFYRAVGSGECHLSDDNSDCFGKNARGIDRKLDTSDSDKNISQVNLHNKLSEASAFMQKLLNTESPLMVPDICCDNIDNSQNTAFIGCDASGHNPYFIDDILSGKNLNQCGTLKGSSCYPLSNEDMLQRDKIDMCYKKTQNRDKDKLPDYEDLPDNADIDQYFKDFKDFCESSQSGEEDSPDKKGECGRFIPYNLPNFPHKKKLDSQWDEGSNKTGKFRFTLPEPIYGENYNYCIESKQIDSGLNITDIDFLDKNFDWYIPESDYEKNYPLKGANDIASCDCCENPDASCNIQCDNNSSQRLRFIKIPDGGPLNDIPFWVSPFGGDDPGRKGTDDPPDTLEADNPYVNVQCKHGTKVKFGPREGPTIREANTEERKKIKEAREKDLSSTPAEQIKVGSIVKTKDNKVGVVASVDTGSLSTTGWWVPDLNGNDQLAYLAFPGSTAACGKNYDQVCGSEGEYGYAWYNQNDLSRAEDTDPGYEKLSELGGAEIEDFNVEEYYYPVQCCPTQEGMISMCDKKCGKTVSSDSWGSGNDEDNNNQTNNRDGDDDDDSDDDSDDEEFNIVIFIIVLLTIAVVAGYFVDPLAGGSVVLAGIFIWIYQTYMTDE